MKSLMLLVTLGVAGCGQDPLAALEEMGASIQKDDEGNVTSIGLNGSKVSDAGLVHLVGLTSLETLHLDQSQVTDAGSSASEGLDESLGT